MLRRSSLLTWACCCCYDSRRTGIPPVRGRALRWPPGTPKILWSPQHTGVKELRPWKQAGLTEKRQVELRGRISSSSLETPVMRAHCFLRWVSPSAGLMLFGNPNRTGSNIWVKLRTQSDTISRPNASWWHPKQKFKVLHKKNKHRFEGKLSAKLSFMVTETPDPRMLYLQKLSQQLQGLQRAGFSTVHRWAQPLQEGQASFTLAASIRPGTLPAACYSELGSCWPENHLTQQRAQPRNSTHGQEELQHLQTHAKQQHRWSSETRSCPTGRTSLCLFICDRVGCIPTVGLVPLLQSLGLWTAKDLKPETHTRWSADTFKGESHRCNQFHSQQRQNVWGCKQN